MKTITFYSYKGGVGRSLALANIAKRLAEFNKKVCIIDFDLEAPGLPLKFQNISSSSITQGIVDYIYSYSNENIIPKTVSEFAIQFLISPNNPRIFLIPAGNTESSEYWRKLSSINWYELLFENNGLSFFLDLKEKIKNEFSPDFLLIDSRTGISEMSGITISLLADEIVVIAANNRENIIGAKKIIQSITKQENVILEKPPKITFVLSRVPFTDKPDDRAKEQLLISKLKKDLSEVYNDEIIIIHSDRDLEENEKLKISSEFEEGFTTISRDYLKLFGKLTKDTLSVDEINKFNKIKEAERLFRLVNLLKNVTEKIETVTKAIALNSIPEYLNYRGLLYLSQKNYESAIKDFQSVLEVDKNNYDGQLNLMEVFYQRGEYKEALKLLDDLSKFYPSSSDVYFKKALVYDKLGETESEIQNYLKAIEIDPTNPIAYNNLANHYRLEKDYDKALELIYKALELNPKQSIALATLAEIYAEQEKINEFYLTFEMALLNRSWDLIESIATEEVYKKFINDEKFNKLLEKYNVLFPDSSLRK